MPNFVKQHTKVAAADQGLSTGTDLLAQATTLKPRFFDRLAIKRGESKVAREIREAELGAIQRETIATINAIAEQGGTEIRADVAREHARTLAAITNEGVTTHRAIVMEQGNGRIAGSMANYQARNEAREEVAVEVSKGGYSGDDVSVLAATISAVHAENEERIDNAYQAQRQQTDHNFIVLGLGSARSILKQS